VLTSFRTGSPAEGLYFEIFKTFSNAGKAVVLKKWSSE
jgi:hypothetical protein